MPMKFMGKNIRHRVVRPIKNSSKYKTAAYTIVNNAAIDKQLEESELVNVMGMPTETPNVSEVKEEQPNKTKTTKRKNNKKKNEGEMESVDKIAKMESIINEETPNSVKVEKKEKGLYERTENSKVILTEDNKMLLND